MIHRASLKMDLADLIRMETLGELFCQDRNNSTTRDTLMPPPVLPAQAPINIKSTRIVFGIVGQRLKSTVAKPVVVMMEAT